MDILAINYRVDGPMVLYYGLIRKGGAQEEGKRKGVRLYSLLR